MGKERRLNLSKLVMILGGFTKVQEQDISNLLARANVYYD